MDINPNTVEQMAREYNRVLENAGANDASSVYEQLIILEEEQLDLLNDISLRSSNRQNRTLSYLRNLVYRSLSVISRMNGDTSYIPSVRAFQNQCSASSVLNRLMILQLDIFILLDRLTSSYSDRAELSMLENRKAALLAGLF